MCGHTKKQNRRKSEDRHEDSIQMISKNPNQQSWNGYSRYKPNCGPQYTHCDAHSDCRNPGEDSTGAEWLPAETELALQTGEQPTNNPNPNAGNAIGA